MAFKKRTSATITTNAGGVGTDDVTLGASYGVIVGIAIADAQFDDNYDVTLTDYDGREIASWTGITAALDEDVTTNGASVVRSPITVDIANGGNVQTGYIDLYVEV